MKMNKDKLSDFIGILTFEAEQAMKKNNHSDAKTAIGAGLVLKGILQSLEYEPSEPLIEKLLSFSGVKYVDIRVDEANDEYFIVQFGSEYLALDGHGKTVNEALINAIEEMGEE